jgi:hypothetical protein
VVPNSTLTGRQVEDGAYLNPYKKLLVDVTASQSRLDKALGFANDLFNALETSGHRVTLAPPNEGLRRDEIDEQEERSKQREYRYSRLWSPYRPTVVYIGTVPIGLAIVEMSEKVLMRYVSGTYIRDADYSPPKASRHYADHTWTTTQSVPSGRLRLVAYSPYWRAVWSTEWQETTKISLWTAFPGIIKAIEDSAGHLIEKLEEATWRAELERLRRDEDRRKVEQSVKDSRGAPSRPSSVAPVSRLVKGRLFSV